MSIVSERIYEAIKRAGLSYGELAEITGIPKSALQRYATGETENIRIGRIWKIAEATNVPVDWLVNWLDLDETPPTQLTPEEERLLHYYRNAEPKYQEFAMEILIGHQNHEEEKEENR